MEVNSVVSLVMSKKNAPVGNWFFQVCCQTPNGIPYMLKCHLAKVYKGDKKLSHWSKWVKAEGNNPVTFSDSLYVADKMVRTFNNKKKLFFFSVLKHCFAHVQKKLWWNVQNISQYSIAWSLKLGMAMTMYLNLILGKKAVLSNAYSPKCIVNNTNTQTLCDSKACGIDVVARTFLNKAIPKL